MTKVWQVAVLSVLAASSVALTSCSSSSQRTEQVDHYVSPQVTGEAAKINLEEVQKAFWDSKGKDFNSWMGVFEKRVNEIYDGKEVVSIDATRKEGKLIVTGYIDKEKKEGFQPGDEKLFTIEQTGEATEDKQMPYRVSDNNDRPYYEGRHSLLDNPFLQMMVFSHFMGGMGSPWGGRYYTPYSTVNVIHSYRDNYRATPQYTAQQQSNQGFFSRFKSSPSGSLQSSKAFGNNGFSSPSTTSKRSWFGGSGGSTPSTGTSGGIFGSSSSESSSSWGGRRSSGGGLFSSGRSSRSWGGRRR